MKKLAAEERTTVFCESPMRLVKTLHELIHYFGAATQCYVSRELTKKFEENKRKEALYRKGIITLMRKQCREKL